MFTSTAIILLLLAIIALVWHSNMQAKELATTACKRLCCQQQVQLLDSTVSLKKLKFKRDQDGRMRILRQYCFDYSQGDDRRYRGFITLLGNQLIAEDLTPFSQTITKTAAGEDTAEVIDLAKYKKASNDPRS